MTCRRRSFLVLGSLLLLWCPPSLAQTWVQQGASIIGEQPNENFGVSVSMPEAGTVAIGGTAYSGTGGQYCGHVQVHYWNGNAWTQKGSDIEGEGFWDQAANVSMPDANTVAIGAQFNSDAEPPAGYVRVFTWTGSDWVQMGDDIHGEGAGDIFGNAVSMPDASTVAVGAYQNDGNGADAGHVRVFSWNGSAWVQKGEDMDGEAAGDQSGRSVSMPDANTVAIGANRNGGNGLDAGHVRVYAWDGSAWVQRGADIDGEAAGDYSGNAVSMPDAGTVAIGASSNSGNGFGSGHVRVYSWNGTAWQQKGADINGEGQNDNSGWSVSMSDADALALGTYQNEDNGTLSGEVRMYRWNGSAWVQWGQDINGEEEWEFSGWAVSLPDSNTVAIASTGPTDTPGHVRIFRSGSLVSVPEVSLEHRVDVYPNPFHDHVTIDLGTIQRSLHVIVRNALGQVVVNETRTGTQRIELTITDAPGIYSVEVKWADGERACFPVIKE